jgi:UDP-galactopyranose mutase
MMAARRTRERGVVCLSTNHWTGLPTGKQHLMRVIAESRDVLYVDPPIDFFSALGRRRRWPELRRMRSVADGLHVLSSVVVAAGSDPDRRARFIETSAARIRRAQEELGLSNPVVWAFAPEHVACRGRLGESLFVYQASDEPAAMSRRPEATTALEERMLERADLIFVVSEALLKTKSRAGKTLRLPNAADRRHYARVLAGDPDAGLDTFVEALASPRAIPADVESLSRPLILHGGAAYGWFDAGLFLEVVGMRPQWTFLLVGPVGAQLRSVRLPANVRAVGRKSYDDFAGYVAAADAAILPWRRGLFSENADPIVLYEYLLCGKPVVATEFPAALERGSLVRTARTAGDFVAALDVALADDVVPSDVRARVAFGFANTWEDRAARALEIIDSRIDGREVSG